MLYKYYTFDDQEEIDQNNQSSQRSDNIRIGLQLGYFHTFILGKYFFISPGAAFGGGYLHTTLLTRWLHFNNETTTQNNLFWRGEAQLAIGYNSDRFFTGIQFTTDFVSYKQENANFSTQNNSAFVNLTLGYRFTAPKFIVESVKRLPYAPGN